MYLARSIEWNNNSANMVGSIPGDVIMETRPQGRGYVQLKQTADNPWPDATDHTIYGHEFHYSRFKNLDKNARFAYKVIRGTGIDGEHDGYIYKNLLACYSHQRNTRNNRWAQRYVDFIRQHKT